MRTDPLFALLYLVVFVVVLLFLLRILGFAV
jgi:hypothetical protein